MDRPAGTAATSAGAAAPVLEPHAMVARHARPLAQRYTLLLAMLAVPLLLFVVGLGLHQFREQQEEELESLARIAREQRLALEGTVKPLGDHVRMLRRMAEDRLAGTEPQPPSPWRELLRPAVSRGPAGPWAAVSLDPVAKGPLRERLGNLVADPSLLARPPEAMREVDMALDLFEPMRLQQQVTPYVVGSYYLSARADMVAVFPFATLASLTAPERRTSAREVVAAWLAHDAFARGTPDRNPAASAYWTRVYQDPADKGWMISHAAPVRDRGRFAGIVGVDLDLRFLGNVLRQLARPAGEAWVVDDDGEVLAGAGFDPSRAQRALAIGEAMAGPLRHVPVAELLRPSGGFRRLGGHWVAAERLEDAPFTLLSVVADGELNGLILPRFLPYLLALGAPLLLLLAAQLVMQRGFVRPALALVRQIQVETEGEPGPPPKVPPLWRPWLEAVHETFSAKRAYEARLAASEARFKAAAESMPDGLAIFDAEDRFAYFNGRYPEHLTPVLREGLRLGVRFEDWLREGQAAQQIYHTEMGADFLQRRLARHREERSEHEQKLTDGRWLRLREARMPDGGRVLLTTDVTARREAESRLQESEARFLAAAENLPDGMVIFDAEDRIVFHNSRHPEHLPPALREGLRLGIRFEDWIREGLARGPVYHEDMGASYAERRLASRGAVTSEREHKHADGRWVRVREGRMPGGGRLLLTTDVTTAKVQADALADQKRKLEAVLANIAEGVSIVDAEGRVVLVNEGLVRLYGYPAELGRPGAHLAAYVEHRIRAGAVSPEEAQTPLPELVARRVARFLAGEPARSEETTEDGRTILVRRERLADGLIVSTHSDVTELKIKERENALLATAVEQAADSVEVTGADYRLTYVNPAFTRLTGWGREAALGRSPADFLRSDRHDAAFYAAMDATLRAGETWHGRLVSRHKDGHLLFQEATISPIRDAAGELTHFVAVKRDIGERIRAEEALRESEARYRAVVESQTELILRLRPDGTLTFLNDAYRRYRGLPRETLLGGFDDVGHYPPAQQTVVRTAWASLSPERPTVSYELEAPLPAGDARFEEWTDTGLFDAQGRLVEIQAVGRDVTARRSAEEALKASEARLAAFMEHAPVGMYVKDLDGRYLMLNPEMGRVFGRPTAEMLGRGPNEVFAPDEVAFIRSFDEEVLARGEPTRHEEFLDEHDAYAWSMVIRFPIRDARGRIVQIGGFDLDITSQKRAQAELAASEARFRTIVEDQTEFISRFTPDFTITFVNQAYAQQLGRPREEIVGTSLTALLTEAQRARVVAQLAALTPEAPTVSYEMDEALPDGEQRWEQWTDRALFDARGRVIEYQSVGRDVTERRRAEDELRRSEQRLRAIAESHPTPMAITRLDKRRIVFANRAFLTAFRLAPEQIAGFDRQGLFADPGERDALFAALAVDDVVDSREIEVRTADGVPFPAVLTAHAIDYEGRRCAVTSFLNLTALKAAEAEIDRQREALHQSEKLTALGALLAGVAHELNNPLSVVTGYAEMLREICDDPATRARVERIHAAAERCARIVKTFLAMARQKPPRRGPVALPEVIEAALELAAYGLRTAGVAVEVNVAPGLPLVWGDADQLHQVVVNLVVNAQQALTAAAAPRRLVLRAGERDGAVELEVEDNGPGMPPEIEKRIFEPFFTTKPQGAGTGIGLSVCHGIVTAHGGRMGVESGPGRGTRFRVRLPVADEAECRPAAAAAPGPPAARGRVLVVDDEAEIADVVAETLRRDGLEVETAGSGRDALARLARGGIDLVVSDLRMPDLDGAALLAALQAERPELATRLILLTGDALGAGTNAVIRAAALPVLEKPLDLAALRREVRRMLELPGSRR